MAVIQDRYISREKLDSEIELTKQKLGPEVVRVKYSVGANMWDDPAIHFRIVLADSASALETLGDVIYRIKRPFFDELRPIENWGMIPYFSFRSQSEQAKLAGLDPDWE